MKCPPFTSLTADGYTRRSRVGESGPRLFLELSAGFANFRTSPRSARRDFSREIPRARSERDRVGTARRATRRERQRCARPKGRGRDG